MKEQNVILVDKLSVRYGNFTAVNSISFYVQRGEVFGFLGPNGSGKTTLIKTLCGLVRPSSGSGSILGLDITKDAEQVRENVGYMSQKFNLYEDLTVEENIDFYAGVYGLKGKYLKRRKDELIALVGIENYLHRQSGKLSGGWKQRLSLICALIHEPAVVFLDEPTAGIDPVARRELWDLLFRFSGQGVTFFVTTHYMDEAERCGRVGYIYYSKLIAYGTPEEIKALPLVSPPDTTRLEVSFSTSTMISSALAFIKNLSYVRDATIFGQSVHVLINKNKKYERFTSDLAEEGFSKATIREITPSLEDAFVALTSEIDKEIRKKQSILNVDDKGITGTLRELDSEQDLIVQTSISPDRKSLSPDRRSISPDKKSLSPDKKSNNTKPL